MCTVTWVHEDGTFICTSNRDEHVLRAPATFPVIKETATARIVFPQDQQAGGTWFAANNRGQIAVLLNGAFTTHVRQTHYRKSRGLILLEIMESQNPFSTLQRIDLSDIEPFTLITFSEGMLNETRWDGQAKHHLELDPWGKHIWSSATLYDAYAIAARNSQFAKFNEQFPHPTSEDILHFHAQNFDDRENGFVIERESGLKTLSTTQVVINSERMTMRYEDLVERRVLSVDFIVEKDEK